MPPARRALHLVDEPAERDRSWSALEATSTCDAPEPAADPARAALRRARCRRHAPQHGVALRHDVLAPEEPGLGRAVRQGRAAVPRIGPAVRRQDGCAASSALLREGVPFYFLPDMDLGARDAVFVPFFGVPAATVPAGPPRANDRRARWCWCHRDDRRRLRRALPSAVDGLSRRDASRRTPRRMNRDRGGCWRCPSSTCGRTSASRRGRRASRVLRLNRR